MRGYYWDEKTVEEKVQKIIENLKSMLEADGGSLEIEEVKENDVVLNLKCIYSGMALETMKIGIERVLRYEIPEIKTLNIKGETS